MAVDLINFKNLEYIPENKNNKIYIDDNNFLNINNNLKINNLNIIESNNIINFKSQNDFKINNNLIYKELYSFNNDSRLFTNIVDIDNNYCLELIDKINIKSVSKDNKESIEIILDNIKEILPNIINEITEFLPYKKEYIFKNSEDNKILVDNIEDGEYKIIDRNNNVFILNFKNNKADKPNNINLKNKIHINSIKCNDYKIFNKNDLIPIILKSIQELHYKLNDINNNITDIYKISSIEKKVDNSLINTQTIDNLNSTYHKVINDINRLQIQHKKYDSIVKENELLKKKINNLEIQITQFVRK